MLETAVSLRLGNSKACQQQEAQVFQCNQLRLVGLPFERDKLWRLACHHVPG